MRHPIVILLVVVACSGWLALASAAAAPGAAAALRNKQQQQKPHPYVEYRDGRGLCRQYTQTNAHWNHSTIWVTEDFARDRTMVSMNVTSKRAGTVKLLLRKRVGTERMQQARLKPFGHGGKGQNFVETSFEDAAEDHFPVWASEAPFTGNFLPADRISRIPGDSKGKWTLLAISRDGKMSHTPEITGWSITFCEGAAPSAPMAAAEESADQGLGLGLTSTSPSSQATAQGAVVVRPMPPATKPVVTYPPPQRWPAYAKPAYSGPNLFSKHTYIDFWRQAIRTVIEVTRNYNEANFYAKQVQTLQKKAYLLRKSMEKAAADKVQSIKAG